MRLKYSVCVCVWVRLLTYYLCTCICVCVYLLNVFVTPILFEGNVKWKADGHIETAKLSQKLVDCSQNYYQMEIISSCTEKRQKWYYQKA